MNRVYTFRNLFDYSKTTTVEATSWLEATKILGDDWYLASDVPLPTKNQTVTTYA